METVATTIKTKCVVWDLDNTLWHGTLLENDQLTLNEDIKRIICALDKRGILHSISSRNDFAAAKKKLIEFGMWDYFIYPEINWSHKSNAIHNIAKNINIGLDTLAFVDDQQFELDEVTSAYPMVKTFSPQQSLAFLTDESFMPRFITSESAKRRHYYKSDILRNEAESQANNNIDFLQSLHLELTIKRVAEEDLQRAEELTQRTHQLNTTGTIYSYETLTEFMHSDKYEVLCCSLKDKYGAYGTIGLALIEKSDAIWTIELLLMSCRVMSRNIGQSLLAFISQYAAKNNATLRARFVENDVNRQMYIMLKFNGFEEIEKNDKNILLEAKNSEPLALPNTANLKSNIL